MPDNPTPDDVELVARALKDAFARNYFVMKRGPLIEIAQSVIAALDLPARDAATRKAALE